MRFPIDAPPASRSEQSAILILAVSALLIGAGPVLVGRVFYAQEPGGSEQVNYDLPAMATLGRALAHGGLPLWEPRMACGYPIFAEGQVGALYPTRWTAAAFPPAVAFSLSFLIDSLLAAFFTFLLCRQLGTSVPSALVAAFTFPLCGFFTGNASHLSFISQGSLLPAAFLFLERGLEAPMAPRPFVLLSIVAGLDLMAGHVQLPYYAALAGALYVLLRWSFGATVFPLGRVTLRLAGAAAGAVLLAAGRLVALLELFGQSVRPAHLTQKVLQIGAVHPGDLLQLVYPWAAGDPSNMTLDFSRFGGTFVLVHIGALALFLALLGLIFPRRPDQPWVLGGLVVAAIICAVAPVTPLELVCRWVPGWSAFKFHGRALVVAELALTVLAAQGLDYLRARTRGVLVGALLIAHAAEMLSLRLAFVPTLPAGMLPGPSAVADQLRRSGPGRTWSLFGADQWIRAYVAVGGWRNNVEPFRQHISLMIPSSSLLFGIPCADGSVPLEPVRMHDLWSAFSPAHVPLQDSPVPLPSAFLRMIGGMGGRYLVSSVPLTAPFLEPRFDSGGGDESQPCRMIIEENRCWVERVRFVGGVRTVVDPRASLLAMGAGDRKPEGEVVLENCAPRPCRRAGSARIRAEGDQFLVVDVQADQAGYLVVLDTYYPGWVATCDGNPAAILVADHAFRAIAVPAGKHQVVLCYRPHAIFLGLKVTVLTGLILTMLWAWFAFRARTSSPSAP